MCSALHSEQSLKCLLTAASGAPNIFVPDGELWIPGNISDSVAYFSMRLKGAHPDFLEGERLKTAMG
jgi:hypothetical protein